MGYYEGQRENPCPRCGGVVGTLFISVSPMSFSQKCHGCGTTEFTEDEDAELGFNQSPGDHTYTFQPLTNDPAVRVP